MDPPTNETHYVSFLSGDGGGMGNSSGSRFRRSARSAGLTARQYLFNKRHFRGIRLKMQLLIVATIASLLLCVGVLLWAARGGGPSDSDLIPVLPVNGGPGSVEGGPEGPRGPQAPPQDPPKRIYDWSEAHFAAAFNRFMTEHAKAYTSLEEKQRRYRIFKANLTHIYLTNEQGYSYQLGMNKFGDWTKEEFSAFVKGFKPNPEALKASRLGVATSLTDRALLSSLPSEVDWRGRGCVTPVKDQGSCGSCWAFSSTGALEGALCARTGRLISLSEQMLMDCSGYLGNMSCNGGLMDDAFTYVQEHGLCLESAYPYEAKDNKCRDKKCKSAITIEGFYEVPQKNEQAMKAALARHGPVSVAIQADELDFQFYRKGVFDAACGSELDHGVLLVGYGTDAASGKDYFIMKNSWGDGWGDQGYMYMAQHKGVDGQCGVLLCGSFPLAEGEAPPEPSPRSMP